jgi:pyruvate-formate lyase-activating enzyme
MIPRLVLSDKKGRIFVHPTLSMLGFDGRDFCLPSEKDVILLPKDSLLFYMPGHVAFGWDKRQETKVSVEKFHGEVVFAVSAFLIPGFTRLYLPSAKKIDSKVTLPLWPYTAVGWQKGRFYACAVKIDPLKRQRPFYYRQGALMEAAIDRTLRRSPENRLFKHLSRCALLYNCRNAQNLFLKRWEAPLPVSPGCNSRCLGCLSFQESDCAQASHERISFVPTPQELLEVAGEHLKEAREPIVSFGQGCEGEPLLQFPLLKKSIALMRQRTQRGTIHLNTNGFCPKYLKKLASLGLNSVRISINSFSKERYQAYYRPCGYKFSDVLASIAQAKKSGLFVSLNYLLFPGASDEKNEVRRLIAFLKKGYVDLLQLRNLSIDPELFLYRMPPVKSGSLGISNMIKLIKKECPGLRLGYFNLPKEKFIPPSQLVLDHKVKENILKGLPGGRIAKKRFGGT